MKETKVCAKAVQILANGKQPHEALCEKSIFSSGGLQSDDDDDDDNDDEMLGKPMLNVKFRFPTHFACLAWLVILLWYIDSDSDNFKMYEEKKEEFISE